MFVGGIGTGFGFGVSFGIAGGLKVTDLGFGSVVPVVVPV
jgi:hypothetical protein